MLARAFSAVGRTLIGAGVLLLLFVSFQLWGTGLHEARAQDTLHTQFAARLDAAPDVAKTASELTPKDPPAGGTSTTSTTATSSTTSTTISVAEETHVDHATPTPVKPGEALARIRIPKIGVDKLVVEGVTVEDLRKGPGHYRATPQPGYPGNASIAGHRTTYGAPFADIDRLVPGDRILVTTLHGNWTYEVVAAPDDPTSGHFIVSPEDVWVLGDFGDNRLTLTACHPKFSASQRIVVVAKLLEIPATPPPAGATAASGTAPGIAVGAVGPETAEATEITAGAVPPDASSLDEGLGGDPSARTPALLWGLVFFLLLSGLWQLSRGWRRLPSYAVGLVPMVIVLFSWFEQIDRWMPAR